MNVSALGKDEKQFYYDIEEFFRRIGIPASIKGLGLKLSEEQIKELALSNTRYNIA